MSKPRGGLTKWFKENWVDQDDQKRAVALKNVAELSQDQKSILNVYLLQKQLV